MRKTQSSYKLIAGALALATAVAVPTSARAVAITLGVDSSLSSLTLSGQAFGAFGLPVYSPQSAGAMSTFWSGTIAADLTGGVFTFTGGSAISAIVNPSGPFTTAPNPIGIEAGNYGVTVSGIVQHPQFGPIPATVKGVYKNLVLDITAGAAQNGLAPAANNMMFTSGALDYGVNPAALGVGTSSLIGVAGGNSNLGLVSWDGTTLTLPVTFHTLGSNRYEDWTGTIVAVVPEPSSLALLGMGLVGLAFARFQRSRQSI